MLKLTTMICGTVISFSAMASTHGGGVLMRNAMMRAGNGAGTMDSLLGSGGGGAVLDSTNGGGPVAAKEIIFNMGQKDGLIRFAYARFEKGQWISQEVEFFESDLISDVSLMRSLQESKVLNSWSEIK